MDTNKLNQKRLTDAGVTVIGLAAGAALGGALGRVVETQLPEYDEVGKIGIVVAGAAGGAMVKGNDTLSKGAKYMALGAAAKQAYDLATGAIKKTITVKPEGERGIGDNLLYGAVGLGCPGGCGKNASYLAAPSITFPRNDVQVLPEPDWAGGSTTGEPVELAASI